MTEIRFWLREEREKGNTILRGSEHQGRKKAGNTKANRNFFSILTQGLIFRERKVERAREKH